MIKVPSHAVHRLIQRLVYDKVYGEVDRIMDAPASYLRKGHRSFWHDPASLSAFFGNDLDKYNAALLHILIDEACTRSPHLKVMLEKMAENKK